MMPMAIIVVFFFLSDEEVPRSAAAAAANWVELAVDFDLSVEGCDDREEGSMVFCAVSEGAVVCDRIKVS